MFFVPLQIGMKKAFTSFAAMLLGLWYLLSVMGFDVHTCATSGKVFIATVASGFTCEDLHPEHHVHGACHSGCACHHHESHDDDSDTQFDVKSCCSDDFHAILLTGTPVSEKDALSDAHTNQCAILGDSLQSGWISEASHSSVFYKPRSWIASPRDRQASYSVWRI